MARNRFEQVDEKQDDAITLSLWKVGDSMYGTVTVPKAVSEGKMPIKDAFRGAIQLANDIKAPVVVVDPDQLWQAEWGDLYRPV